jgi:putative heme-binding domain-containing protein
MSRELWTADLLERIQKHELVVTLHPLLIDPDLASVIQHPPEKLLRSILDPNADIQPGYTGYTCTLASGEQIYGLVSTETANSVTLKLPDASQRTIPRNDIRSLQSQNVSLMPEGFENAISPKEMADLLAFLRSELR